MSIHVLLGATGSTGSAVLQYLLDEPITDLKLRICVRNKSKLLDLFPNLETSKTIKHEVIEATLDDTAAMQRLLKNADVVYNCIASNYAGPVVTVARDSATAIIRALRVLKQDAGESFKAPLVLVNRSATLNDKTPKAYSKSFFRYVLSSSYDDLKLACSQYRSAADKEQLLDLIIVDPPALHAGTMRTGHELLLEGEHSRSLSYPDLGAAFVEIGQRRREFSRQAVIVSATGEVEEHWDVLRGYLFRGLQARLFGV